LLNSDTLAPARFVDRIVDISNANPRYGVITPLSNNATIFSFPICLQDNTLQGLEELDQIDELLRIEGGHTVCDVPTGHGYCMFVKGEVFEKVGVFDAEEWGVGYGEENDLCQRAKMHGWGIGASVGMYVGHTGSVSFGVELREKLVAENLQKLNVRYPEFDDIVRRHIKKKTDLQLWTDRLQISLYTKRVRAESRGTMLFLSHGLGGGTNEYINRSKKALGIDNMNVLTLTTEKNGAVLLSSSNDNLKIQYSQKEINQLMIDLRKLDLSEVVVNSAFNFSFTLINAVLSTNCSVLRHAREISL